MDPLSALMLQPPFRSNGKQTDKSDRNVATLSSTRSGLKPELSTPPLSRVSDPLSEKPLLVTFDSIIDRAPAQVSCGQTNHTCVRAVAIPVPGSVQPMLTRFDRPAIC